MSDAKAARVLARSESPRKACEQVQVSWSEPAEDGWIPFTDVSMTQSTILKGITSSSLPRKLDGVALVIFTSGTTSTSKGWLHTSANLLSQINDFDPQGAVAVDRWLVHTPVSHVFANQHHVAGPGAATMQSFPLPSTLTYRRSSAPGLRGMHIHVRHTHDGQSPACSAVVPGKECDPSDQYHPRKHDQLRRRNQIAPGSAWCVKPRSKAS